MNIASHKRRFTTDITQTELEIYGMKLSGALGSELSISTPQLGFNGCLFDSITGCYHLGNGYRLYNPALRTFYSPDSFSPFGAGGVNRYQYCNLNPINFIDPSGHISVQAGVGVALSVVGILLSVYTLGASLSLVAGAAAMTGGGALAVGLGVTTSVLGLASGATGIASHALEESDPVTSEALGWASLGLGIGSMITGIGGAVATTRALRMANNPGRNLETMLARGRVRGILEGGVPTRQQANYQFLPYKSGSVQSMRLNNTTPYFATDELTGCAMTVSRSGGNVSVSHIAANYMEKPFWRLMNPARNILRENAYGEMARFAGGRVGKTWAFGYQKYSTPVNSLFPRPSGEPIILNW
ncbi:RHS repeat-associated core domain-containing protein [Pseudomonas chlororaphis]|uniref:RHS repeat-associated core domain-containing protein n=1 Tax=Pseudomonas chlororaphis TaxID=587753 RepID=UPI0015DF34DF|nr:RHS repeat-associated core domain-containing protein [Pseudomonas chlororaphis]QLL16009.1 RHS repeat-associated core domain-containing protein [Pseudomonas chlororaphis subsp. aurantiaca]